MVLPKAGLSGFDWAFVQGSLFVLRLNFCTKNPRLRQYPSRLMCFTFTFDNSYCEPTNAN